MEFNVPWLHGRILMEVSGGEGKNVCPEHPSSERAVIMIEAMQYQRFSNWTTCQNHMEGVIKLIAGLGPPFQMLTSSLSMLRLLAWGPQFEKHCSHWICSCSWLVMWPLCSLGYFWSGPQTWKFKVSVRRNNIWLQKNFYGILHFSSLIALRIFFPW